MSICTKKKLFLFKYLIVILNMKNNQYSIKDLENLTNIKAHTIRIWEQRYGLLEPKRTSTNIRYYEDKDLKKILNINLLYTNGLKISKIAKLTEDEIIERSRSLIEERDTNESQDVDVLLMAILDLNDTRIEEILEETFRLGEIEDFYSNVINPLLFKIGDLWQLNSISIGHEHFFSNMLRAFLLSKTRDLTPAHPKDSKALLFLPPKEEHELSLLFYSYIFKREGWQVIYLGNNVPFEDLKVTYDQVMPDMVVTSMIKNTSEQEFVSTVKKITDAVPVEKLIFSGTMAMIYKDLSPKKVRLISGKEDLKAIFV